MTALGPQLRLQARRGYRAAVVELRPGMYVVAEVPEAAIHAEFGVAPLLLAPLLVNAATKALQQPAKPPAQRLLPQVVQALQPRAAAPSTATPSSCTALVPMHSNEPRWMEPDDLPGGS